MKKTLLSTIALTFISIASFSANFEGEINFQMKYTQVPEGMEMFKAMTPQKILFRLKNHMFRVDMKQPMGTFSTIVNSKTGTSILLTKIGKKKKAEYINTTGAEQDTVKIIKKTGTKTILGYECKKAIMRGNSGKTLVTYWYSEQFQGYNSPEHPNLKLDGFPLEYTVTVSGMTMVTSATKVTKKSISSSIFEIPEDYEVKKTK